MGRIKLAERWIERESRVCEVYACLRDIAGPDRPADLSLHVTGFDGVAANNDQGLVQIRETGATQVSVVLAPWQLHVPAGLVQRLSSRVLVQDVDVKGDLSGRSVPADQVVARIQPEFLAPAVAAEIASRMRWPITQLQMAECIARACALGQWSAPVVNLSTFSVRLQFEGERLRLIRIDRDGVAGGDLKAAERVRYVRDCEAGRFSISTPVEVFEGSGEPDRSVQILAEVGLVIGTQPYEDSPCFEDEASQTRARSVAMRG